MSEFPFWKTARTILSATVLFGMLNIGASFFANAGDGRQTITISAGPYLTLAHDVNGQVWGWGDNFYKQLTNASQQIYTNPVPVVGFTNIISVAAGGFAEYYYTSFTFALTRDGKVLAMGDNQYGSLGNGTVTTPSSPGLVTNLSGVIAIAGGGYHGVALKADGTVWDWGHNGQGQLGNNTTTAQYVPVQASGLSNVVAVSSAGRHNLALKADGTVWGWGYNYYAQIGNGNTTDQLVPVQVSTLTNIVAVSAGGYHSLALMADGSVWGWGGNAEGEVGNNTTAQQPTPVKLSGLANIVAISAGTRHSLALRADGQVFAWGQNVYGAIGDGTTTDRHAPVPVNNLTRIVAISASCYHHSIALDSDGNLYGWGLNNYGQLADAAVLITTPSSPSPNPTPISTFGIVGLRGKNHTLLSKSDGDVEAFGANQYGQLGTLDQVARSSPTAAAGVSELVSVAVGGSVSAGLRYDGAIVLWGAGDFGQQISGAFNNRLAATLSVPAANATQLAAGAQHLLALQGSGAVQAWGDNRMGQLGDGTTSNRTNLVSVSGLAIAAQVAAGGQHSLAVGTNGLVYGWGADSFGQLGDGAAVNRTSPASVTGLTGVVQVAAGLQHSLALTGSGNVWGWGDNRCGQVGDGTLTLRRSAVQLTGLSNVLAIACAGNSSYAVTTSGAVWAWGGNAYGQVGDGTFANRSTPVLVTNVSGFRSIQTGDNHVLLVLDDNSALVWGANQSGQLGLNSWYQNTPALLSGLQLAQSAYNPFVPSTSAASSRFVRGTGTNATYQSFVLPLSGQKGLAFANTGGTTAGLYPGTPWSTNYYHFDATNAGSSNTLSKRITFANPIVAFGSRGGGTPLYFGQHYQFGVYAGDWTSSPSNALVIQVYNRTNMARVATTYLPLPTPGQSNDWSDFLHNGYSRSVTTYGVTTILTLDAPQGAWGTGTNQAIRLNQVADSTTGNYVFEVDLVGRTADQGWMAVDSGWQSQVSRLYALEFEERPAWRATFINQPQFAGDPLPPFYDGKSVGELLTNNPPAVTNTVSLTNAITTYTNIDISPELRRHPLLDGLVADLGRDPIAIANYVLNEIDLTDGISYNDNGGGTAIAEQSINLGGVNRGALATFLERQGSPMEQCSLLVYLLRQAGVPAVYMFAPHNGLKMLDARMSRLLRMQLHGEVSNQGASNMPSMIPVNYPWVAAYVNGKWVHLFPWIKDTEIIEGLNLYDYMPVSYNNGYKWLRNYVFGAPDLLALSYGDDTPSMLFPKYATQVLLTNAPGVSLDDIGVRIRNRRHYDARWQDFPNPTWLTNTCTAVESLGVISGAFPAMTNLFDTVNIQVYSVSNPTNQIATGDLRTMDLHTRQLLLWYQTNGSGHNMILALAPFRPDTTNRVLFSAVNGLSNTDTNVQENLVATNFLASTENQLSFKITHKRHRSLADSYVTNPPARWDAFLGFNQAEPNSQTLQITQERPLRKGDLAALCLNVGRVSGPMLNIPAQQYWQLQQVLSTNAAYTNQLTPEQFQGNLTYLLGMSYFERANRFREVNQRLHKAQMVSWYAAGLAILEAKRNTDGTLPSGALVWNRPALDIFFQQVSCAGNGQLRPDNGDDPVTGLQDFYHFLVADASAQEHQTINSFFQQDQAISTVKLLQLAQQQTNSTQPGILELNINNYLALATNTYGSGTSAKALKDFDQGMWQTISNAFATTSVSNYVQVFMTPGLVTNQAGSHVGALVLGQSYFAALISTNLNGGEGESVPDSSISYANSPSVDLWFTPIQNYDSSWPDSGSQSDPFSNNSTFDGNYWLTYSQPTTSSPSYMPSSPSDWDFLNYHNQLNNGTTLLTPSQSSAYSDFRVGYGLSPTTPAGDTFLQMQDDGWLGPPSFKDPTRQAADPVDIMTGDFYINHTDLALFGPLNLTLTRNYSSRNPAANELGYGWKPAYFPYLSVTTNSTVIYAAEMDGSVIAYRYQTNNLWLPTILDNPQLRNLNEGAPAKSQNPYNARLVQSVVGSTTNYTLTSPDGSVRTFVVRSFPVSTITRQRPYLDTWVDSRGNSYRFTFGTDSTANDYGELHRVDCSNGNSLGFYYDAFARITEAFTSDGRRSRYEYDDYGDLIQVTLPDESAVKYEYQHKPSTAATYGWVPYTTTSFDFDWSYINVTTNYWTSVANGWCNVDIFNGMITTTCTVNYYVQLTPIVPTYSTHLLVREVKPDGRLLENHYDDLRRVTNQWATVGIDLVPLRNATFTYANDFSTNSTATNLISGYTLIGDILNNTSRYDYTNSLITKVTDALQQSVTKVWFGAADTNVTGYYPRSLRSVTDKRGLVNSYQYDISGNLTNLTTTGDLLGGGSTDNAVNSFGYTTNNLLQSVVDPLSFKTQFTYGTNYPFLVAAIARLSPAGALVTSNSMTYANFTNVSSFATNTSFGVLVRMVEAASFADAATTDYGYDGRGQMTAQTNYTGTTDPNVTGTFFYNNRGELVQRTDALGRSATYVFDPMGNQTAQEIYEAGATTPLSWEYRYYNENGELTWTDGSRYNPEDYVWRDYDGGGRKIQEIRWRSRAKADGSGVEAEVGDNLFATIFNEYDGFGNLMRTTDQFGNFMLMSYDVLGQMTSRRRHGENSPAPLSVESFGYEPGGQVSAATNALGGATFSFYNSAGKLKQRINPDGTTNSWRFDLQGRVTQETLSNGNAWNTSYDDVNRTVTRTFSADSGNTETSVYDRRGNVISRTTSVGAVFTATFDGLNRVKTATGPSVNGVQQSTTYSYDAAGQWVKTANALGEYTITYFDAAGRSVTNEIHDAASNLVRKTVTAYAADGNSVTTIAGTGSTAITNTVFTDTFGKAVLAQSFPSVGVTNSTRNVYDVVENLSYSLDELGQTNRFTYDPLYRLQSQITPDGATVSFGYDGGGNMTNRTMPGSLVWSATYDSAGRKLAEQLKSGASVTRQFNYGYYGSLPNLGLPQTIIDVGRTVTNTFAYDGLFRIVTNFWGGPQSEHMWTNVYAYDRRGLVTNLAQTSLVGVSSGVARSYDAAGELTSEAVTLNGVLQSTIAQSWNTAGRRSGLTPLGTQMSWGFQQQADGLLTEVDTHGDAYFFDYDVNGLLVSRSNPWRTQTFTQRDGRGRVLGISDYVGPNLILSETLTWRTNSTLNSYAATRGGTGAWNESRSFAYNSRGQLTSEGVGLATGSSATDAHTYDSNLLGVHLSSTLTGALTNNWSVNGSLDAFGRVPKETVNLASLTVHATGTARGAKGVGLTLDGSTTVNGVQFDPASVDGRWTVDTAMGTGSHTLAAVATNAFGGATTNASSTFTVLGQNQLTNTYDGVGNLVTRTMTGGKTMTLKWDSLGRLLSATQLDGSNNGYTWAAYYDGLGRRLRTVRSDLTNNVTVGSSTVTVDSFYDPQVEFLELGVSVNGTRTWKVYGPDLAGSYGAQQGIGGLEATVRESDGQTVSLLSDYFGNTLAGGVTQAQVTWSGTRLGGYGPVEGYQVPVLGTQFGLAESTLWRGKRIDPTGFYWFGARYYDPTSGRWLSPDPKGHAASMSLYDYANNDPVNGLDADGNETVVTGFDSNFVPITANQFPGTPGSRLDWQRNYGFITSIAGKDDFDRHFENVMGREATYLFPYGSLNAFDIQEAVDRGYLRFGDLPTSWSSDRNSLHNAYSPAMTVGEGIHFAAMTVASAAFEAAAINVLAPFIAESTFDFSTFAKSNPTLYWHGSQAAVDARNASGIFVDGVGAGRRNWATSLKLEETGVDNWKLGGNTDVNLFPPSLVNKGGFEATYTLTDTESAMFKRAWGFDFNWNPAQWWKGAVGQYYYQGTAVTLGQRMLELANAGTIVGAGAGVSYGINSLSSPTFQYDVSSQVTLSKHY